MKFLCSTKQRNTVAYPNGFLIHEFCYLCLNDEIVSQLLSNVSKYLYLNADVFHDAILHAEIPSSLS